MNGRMMRFWVGTWCTPYIYSRAQAGACAHVVQSQITELQQLKCLPTETAEAMAEAITQDKTFINRDLYKLLHKQWQKRWQKFARFPPIIYKIKGNKRKADVFS